MSGTQIIEVELRPTLPTIELRLPDPSGTPVADARLAALVTGPKGEPGATEVQYPALAQGQGVLGGHRVVMLTADGTVNYADARNPEDARRILGITTGAAVNGESANIQTTGPMIESSWSWVPDEPVYLGQDGLLTQTVPTWPSAAFLRVMGVAISPTTLLIGMGPVIHLTP